MQLTKAKRASRGNCLECCICRSSHHWLPIQSSVENSHFVTSLHPMGILGCVYLCSMSNWIWVDHWSQLLQLCLTLKRYSSLPLLGMKPMKPLKSHGYRDAHWCHMDYEKPWYKDTHPSKSIPVFLKKSRWLPCGKPRIAQIKSLQNSLQYIEWSTVRFLVVVSQLPQDCFAQFSSYWIQPRPPHDHRRQHWCQHWPRYRLMVGWLNKHLDSWHQGGKCHWINWGVQFRGCNGGLIWQIWVPLMGYTNWCILLRTFNILKSFSGVGSLSCRQEANWT